MAKSKINQRLTEKQERFCKEYIIDLNATQAAKRAGYSDKTAFEIGYQLLKKTLVQEIIQAQMDARAKRLDITADRVLKEYAKIAFSDIRKFYDEKGHLKHPKDIDDDSACALSAIETEQIFSRDGDGIGIVKKIKVHNKLGALDSIARHLGMFEKDNKQKADALGIQAAKITLTNGTVINLD